MNLTMLVDFSAPESFCLLLHTGAINSILPSSVAAILDAATGRSLRLWFSI
jgi:hypothetical protein